MAYLNYPRRLQLKVSRDGRIESIKTDLIERRYQHGLVVCSQGKEAIIVNYCRSKLHILMERVRQDKRSIIGQKVIIASDTVHLEQRSAAIAWKNTRTNEEFRSVVLKVKKEISILK